MHDDREEAPEGGLLVAGAEEADESAYYASGGNNITVRISASRRGPREVSDTTGAPPACMCDIALPLCCCRGHARQGGRT